MTPIDHRLKSVFPGNQPGLFGPQHVVMARLLESHLGELLGELLDTDIEHSSQILNADELRQKDGNQLLFGGSFCCFLRLFGLFGGKGAFVEDCRLIVVETSASRPIL